MYSIVSIKENCIQVDLLWFRLVLFKVSCVCGVRVHVYTCVHLFVICLFKLKTVSSAGPISQDLFWFSPLP